MTLQFLEILKCTFLVKSPQKLDGFSLIKISSNYHYSKNLTYKKSNSRAMSHESLWWSNLPKSKSLKFLWSSKVTKHRPSTVLGHQNISFVQIYHQLVTTDRKVYKLTKSRIQICLGSSQGEWNDIDED